MLSPGQALAQDARPAERTSAKPPPETTESIANLFTPGGARAVSAVVMFTGVAPMPPESVRNLPDMLRRLRGVAAVLDQPGVAALKQAVGPTAKSRTEQVPPALWDIYLTSKAGTSRGAVLAAAEGACTLRAGLFDAAPGHASEERVLVRKRFDELTQAWPAYRGKLRDAAAEPTIGAVFQLDKPYTPAEIRVDRETIAERILGGRPTQLPGSTRDLGVETFWCRLPKEYSPMSPAGLLVWVDANPDGRPPQVFAESLDALNMICVGAADSGNDRPVVERYQLALDAAATARRRYHVDATRVYISGISGGGRVSSLLCACFPDVFTGCIPIVGMSSYHDAPAPGGMRYPAGFARPGGRFDELLHQRRFAPITGEKDMNHQEIWAYVQQHSADGLPIKMFDYPDMAHTLPTPARFREALDWVDEPAHDRFAKEREASDSLMAAAIARFGEGPAKTPAHRAAMVEVITSGPWTPAAWQAVDRLDAQAPPGK